MTEKSHAKFYRNLVRAGLCAAALFNVQVASAGYAQLAPPPGWSVGTGPAAGAGGSFNMAAAANDARMVGNTVRTNAALNVGGRAVTVPATMRFAANAPRIAAAVLFANPYLRAGVAIASWLGLAKLVWDAERRAWVDPTNGGANEVSNGYEYTVGSGSTAGQWYPSASAACGSFTPGNGASFSVTSATDAGCVGVFRDKDGVVRNQNYQVGVLKRPSSCPAGWYATPAGCTQTPQPKVVNEEEFVRDLTKQPMPSPVPSEVPAPLPIELPEVQPKFEPMGDPVKNPNYDPAQAPSPANQPYLRPGIDIKPAPTPEEPWRVDTKPINVPQPTPNPEDTPDPHEDPDSKPEEKEPDLCEKYPDILACQKPDLDTPDEKIPKSTREVTIDFVDGGDGSCPADAYSNVGGQSLLVWDWQSTCAYTRNYVKPVILAGAMFMALMIVLGGTKE